MPAWVIPAITAVATAITGAVQRNREKKAYQRQQRYNSPKEQMKRYSEAGLSPYLIYGQGSSGNMSQPAPTSPIDTGIEKGLDTYISMEQFKKQQKQLDEAIEAAKLANKLNEKLMDDKVRNLNVKTDSANVDLMTKIIDAKVDNPGLITPYDSYFGGDLENVVERSFKNKMNEMKLAISKQEWEKVEKLMEGMTWDNIVKRVKSIYADDYGMVGGDWTQGLGLLRSLSGMIKRPRKIVTTRNLNISGRDKSKFK